MIKHVIVACLALSLPSGCKGNDDGLRKFSRQALKAVYETRAKQHAKRMQLDPVRVHCVIATLQTWHPCEVVTSSGSVHVWCHHIEEECISTRPCTE